MKLLPFFPFTWESQLVQYPPTGEPGLGYFAGVMPHALDKPPVDCLLWRSDAGVVQGVLNYFPVDYPPWEKAGNITLIVDPARRHEGIALRLLTEAASRWEIDWAQQAYTEDGLLVVLRFLAHAQRWTDLNAVMSELERLTTPRPDPQFPPMRPEGETDP